MAKRRRRRSKSKRTGKPRRRVRRRTGGAIRKRRVFKRSASKRVGKLMKRAKKIVGVKRKRTTKPRATALVKRIKSFKLPSKTKRKMSPAVKRILANARKLASKQSGVRTATVPFIMKSGGLSYVKTENVTTRTKIKPSEWSKFSVARDASGKKVENYIEWGSYKDVHGNYQAKSVTTYYTKEGQPGKLYARTLKQKPIYNASGEWIGNKVTNWGTARAKFAGFTQDAAGKLAEKRWDQNRREDRRDERARLRGLQEEQTQAELEYLGELKGEQQRLYGQQEKKLSSRRWGPRVARARRAQLTELRKRKAKLKPLTGYSWAEQIQKYMQPTEQKLNALNKRLSGRTKQTTGRKLSGRTSRKSKR